MIRPGKLTIGVLSVVLLSVGQGRAQTPAPPAVVPISDAEIRQGRAAIVNDILTNDMPGLARSMRRNCAFDDGPAEVAKARAAGRITAPDAADSCIASLTRQAHDGGLMSLYQDKLERETGSLDGAETLPKRIVDAIRDGSNKVDIGAGHTLAVTPGLAFDVGFSSAYWDGNTARTVHIADEAKLKAATESCVAQRADGAFCLGVGYAQGAAAFKAAHATAAR